MSTVFDPMVSVEDICRSRLGVDGKWNELPASVEGRKNYVRREMDTLKEADEVVVDESTGVVEVD